MSDYRDRDEVILRWFVATLAAAFVVTLIVVFG